MPSHTFTAATLPGEADILATVVADLNDDTAKLVYADWLDERDDPRGPVLRQFVEAVRKGKTLPDLFGLAPDSWLNIVGYHFMEQLQDLKLKKHRATVFRFAKPAVAVDTTSMLLSKKVPIGGTQFGGLPSLSKGTTWPRCERGPLQFLAQLNLAELSRTVAGRRLPGSGLLSFFMYHNYSEDEYGEGRGPEPIAGGLRVIHTPPGKKLAALRPPRDLTENLGRPRDPCEPYLYDVLDIPDVTTEPWEKFFPPTVRRNYVEGLRSAADTANHQLFGYSHVTVLVSDPTPGSEWEQLIRFRSNDKLGWGWGDGHRLFWYIRSEDLRAHRFDNTVAIDG